MKKTISNASKTIAALALAFTLTTKIASAQSAYPPTSVLAAQWWRWAESAPAPVNPVADQTGQFAAVNQPQGNLWFLAGNFGGTTVRTVTIPAGKALFFPIQNIVDVEDGIVTPGGTKVFLVKQPLQTAQGLVSYVISTAYGMSCSVDGNDVPITAANLEQSNPFSLQLPTDNVFGYPAGVYFPAVDSGYYVLLHPLSRGQHTIHFEGCTAFFNDFCLDVTYNITVQ